MPFHAQFYRTSTVGQGDPVSDVRSGLAIGSVRARLQLSVQRLRLVPPWLSQNLICTFGPPDPDPCVPEK